MSFNSFHTEKFVPLNQATRYLPGRPHRSTVWRVALHGSRGIRLRTVVCGARRFTTLKWIEEYLAARTAAAEYAVKSDTPPQSSAGNAGSSPGIIKQDNEAAIEEQLDALGIRAKNTRRGRSRRGPRAH